MRTAYRVRRLPPTRQGDCHDASSPRSGPGRGSACVPAGASQGGIVFPGQQDSHAGVCPGEALEGRQYRLPETRVAGQEYVRQSVTIWEVTAGTWNGQSLKGLSLVLVRSTSDVGPSREMTNCYVSHLASAAQREALVGAYVAAQSLAPGETASWRVEPAVIRFEIAGQTLVIHLGLVA